MAITSRIRAQLRRISAPQAPLAAIEAPRADARRSALEPLVVRLEAALSKAEARQFAADRVRLLQSLSGADPSWPSRWAGHANGTSSPAVSIVMATRNRAHCIGEAIDSVRRQTLQAWELIVVDDGSTDDTASIAAKYLEDSRIRYVRTPPRGASAARNRGLELSNGPCIAYLDSDNLYFPDFLLAAVEALEADHSIDLVYGALVSDHHGRARAPLVWEPFDRSRLLQRNSLDLNTIVHRRALFEKHGGFDERLDRLLDWDLVLKYTQHSVAMPIPVLAARYRVVDTARITEVRSESDAYFKIRKKWQPVGHAGRLPRVLYVLWHYPQLSETYIETEIRCMQRWGVHVEVWAETTAASAYETTVPIHRGSLADAVAAARPDILHVHWLTFATQHRAMIDEVELPVTIRVHGFEFSGEALNEALSWERVHAIYGFPHHVAASARPDPRLRAIPSAFDTELFTPAPEKDRRLIVRTSAGLPSKDLALFFDLAKRLPEYRFVLAAVTCKDRETCIDDLREEWRRSGTPAELRIDMPRDEIAALVGRAGIYVHTARVAAEEHATPVGGPISIAEAMATGAYLLVRDTAPLVAYVGDAGVAYRDVEHAASIILATEQWSDADWQDAWKRSVDRAFLRHADDIALRPILDDWLALHDAAVTAGSPVGSDDEYALCNGGDGVDAAWYRDRYSDVASAGVDPVLHYLQYGWREGRDPRPGFSTTRYLSSHPELSSAGLNPLVHALRLKHFIGSGSNGADEIAAIARAFDREYYLRRYEDVLKVGLDPVRHYVESGAREGRDPSPEFDTQYYLNRYPDVVASGLNPFFHYLTIGRVEGRAASRLAAGDPEFDAFCHVIDRPAVEVTEELNRRRRDLRARLDGGPLKDVVARASDLEPLIRRSSLAAMTPVQPPFRGHAPNEVVAIDWLQSEAGRRRARAIVVTRASDVRGAARVAGHLATALAGIYGHEEILVLRTESSELRSPRWFPAGCRHVDFTEAARPLTQASRERVFVEFLRSLRPSSVFNVHSALCWNIMRPYGKALASSMALYAYLFCNDLDLHGQPIGYASTEFYRHFDSLTGVITDSAQFADELRERFQIPPSLATKLVTLETPVMNEIVCAPAPERIERRRPQIFWAGRFDRQKRPDIVMAVAARMPDVDVHLWGMSVLDDGFANLSKPANVLIEGAYRDFSELPLERCDVWMYTSQWDGVPNVLLEVAAAGIPLVSSIAGGASDVLIDGLCHRIADVEDVDAFVGAIRAVLADPIGARARARELRERLGARRSGAAYRSSLARLLGSPA